MVFIQGSSSYTLNLLLGNTNLNCTTLGSNQYVLEGSCIFTILCFIGYTDNSSMYSLIVDFREIYVLAALLGGSHSRNNHIYVAGNESCQKSVKAHVLNFQLNAQILGNFFCQLNVETYDGILSINQCVELVGRIVGRSSQDNLSRCLDFFQ